MEINGWKTRSEALKQNSQAGTLALLSRPIREMNAVLRKRNFSRLKPAEGTEFAVSSFVVARGAGGDGVRIAATLMTIPPVANLRKWLSDASSACASGAANRRARDRPADKERVGLMIMKMQ
jgi:hypothetical protein